jgi:uncharacterized protein (TIGR00297 family)
MISPLLAAVLSAVLSLAGWRARFLTPSGAGAAFAVGLSVLAGTGWVGGAVLAAFFLSSSTVSRLTESRQSRRLDPKGNRRDPWQVAANGGVAAVGGLVGWLSGEMGLWIVTASLAAAASDTWATSLGALSRRDPVDVVRWRRVPTGASGGVSIAGTLGGLAGAALVAGTAVAAGGPASLFLPAVALGMTGMVADSVLGATVQGRFHCPSCGTDTERRRHRCGTVTEHTGGWRWLGNDGVNALATGLAGCAAAGWWAWVCCS